MLLLGGVALELEARAVRVDVDHARGHAQLVTGTGDDELAVGVDRDRGAGHEHAAGDEIARELVVTREIEHHDRPSHARPLYALLDDDALRDGGAGAVRRVGEVLARDLPAAIVDRGKAADA